MSKQKVITWISGRPGQTEKCSVWGENCHLWEIEVGYFNVDVGTFERY